MKRWATLLAASAAAAGTSAWAQENETGDDIALDAAVPLETGGAETTSLGRIVSSWRDRVAIDTPQATSVVNREDLDRLQPETVGDAIDALPGVQTVGSERPLGESFNIRGIGSAAASDEPRIIVAIDGATKFFEQYRMGSLFAEPELFKSVEVLRGPASSTLYGSGAIAGVINLETIDPSDILDPGDSFAFRQRIGYAWGENDAGYNGVSIAAWRPTDRAEFLIAGSLRDTPEYQDGDGEVVDGTENRTYAALAKAIFTLGEDYDHTIEISYTHFETTLNDEPYSQTGLGGGIFSAFGTADRDVVDQTATIAYTYTPADAPWIDLKITGGYALSSNYQDDPSSFAVIGAFGDEWTVEYETWTLQAENTASLHGEEWVNHFTFGSQYAFQDRVSESFLYGSPYLVGSHPAGTQSNIGFFAQNEFIYDDWLTIVPGARIDLISTEADESVASSVTIREHDFTLFSPKLAAMAQLTDEIALFGSLARTERAPVLDELYDVDNYAVAGVIGDPDVEVATNYEIGLAFSFNDVLFDADALQLRTTAFHTEIDDLIYRASDGQPYGNEASATYDGIEIEAAYDAGFAFGSAAYTMIRGELDDGTYLNSIPADEFRLTLGGRYRPYNIEFGWSGTFVAGQDRVSDPSSTVPGGGAPTDGYVVHDLFVGWTPDDGLLEGSQIRLTAQNITDRAYREHLSGDNAPGFTLRLSLTQDF